MINGLVVFALLGVVAPFSPESAEAVPSLQTTLVRLAGEQSQPCPLSSGVVYQHDLEGDGLGVELWFKPWDGVSVRLEATSARSFLSPRGEGDYVAYLDVPDPDLGTGTQTGPWRVVLRKVSSGEKWILSETDTPKMLPDVSGDRVVWSEHVATEFDVLGYDLARDDDIDGVPNYREAVRPVPDAALTVLVGGPVNQRQPAIGAAGLVWAEGDGDKSVLLRPSPAEPSFSVVDAASGSSAPAPDTAGQLVVWSKSSSGQSSLRMKNVGTGVVTTLDTPDVDSAPSTDGERVAWTSWPGGVPQTMLRWMDGTSARVSPTSSRQTAPRLGGGALVWVDERNGDADIAVVRLDTPSPEPRTFKRISGRDRYETAALISKSAYPDGCESAVLATGQNFADALAASALAGAAGGPLLLTQRTSLPVATATELTRLGVKRLYTVGGAAAIAPSVLDGLRARGLEVLPLYGENRYETASKVAAKVKTMQGAEFGAVAFVARGDDFADALAAAPIAARMRYPVLLTTSKSLSPETAKSITALGIRKLVVVGGEGAVAPAVYARLTALVDDTRRVSGANRYATAGAIAQECFSLGWTGASFLGVASGTAYPDALAGGVAAGASDGVLLLTAPTTLPDASRVAFERWAPSAQKGALFGGTNAVSASVEKRLLASW